MPHTFEEIREAYQERATSEYAKVRTSLTGEDLVTIFDHIAGLETANAALQAQVGVLAKFEGWRDTKTFPRVEHSIPSAVHTETVDVLIIVRMYHTLIREGKIESYWQDDINRVENDRVLGWRYIPDESPAAAESEE